MHNRPSRRQEALHYWMIMCAPPDVMPFEDRKAELQMLAQHCRSDVLHDLCEKNINAVGRRPVRQRMSEVRA